MGVTIDQKLQRFDDSEQFLELFNCIKHEILRRYMTMYETWLHNFTPESNLRKTQKLTGKVMASVF